MKEHNSNGSETLGVETAPLPVPDLPTIKKWIAKDLGVAITLLTAIRDHPDTLNQVAIFLEGRMHNAKNAPPDPNQGKLFN